MYPVPQSRGNNYTNDTLNINGLIPEALLSEKGSPAFNAEKENLALYSDIFDPYCFDNIRVSLSFMDMNNALWIEEEARGMSIVDVDEFKKSLPELSKDVDYIKCMDNEASISNEKLEVNVSEAGTDLPSINTETEHLVIRSCTAGQKLAQEATNTRESSSETKDLEVKIDSFQETEKLKNFNSKGLLGHGEETGSQKDDKHERDILEKCKTQEDTELAGTGSHNIQVAGPEVINQEDFKFKDILELSIVDNDICAFNEGIPSEIDITFTYHNDDNEAPVIAAETNDDLTLPATLIKKNEWQQQMEDEIFRQILENASAKDPNADKAQVDVAEDDIFKSNPDIDTQLINDEINATIDMEIETDADLNNDYFSKAFDKTDHKLLRVLQAHLHPPEKNTSIPTPLEISNPFREDLQNVYDPLLTQTNGIAYILEEKYHNNEWFNQPSAALVGLQEPLNTCIGGSQAEIDTTQTLSQTTKPKAVKAPKGIKEPQGPKRPRKPRAPKDLKGPKQKLLKVIKDSKKPNSHRRLKEFDDLISRFSINDRLPMRYDASNVSRTARNKCRFPKNVRETTKYYMDDHPQLADSKKSMLAVHTLQRFNPVYVHRFLSQTDPRKLMTFGLLPSWDVKI